MKILAPPLLWLVLCLLLAPAALGAQKAPKKDPRLEEAQRLLYGPQEDTVRKGARLCAEIDSEESMQLMLKTLNDTQPHFRDIAWEALPDFKDPYARQLVALELARNKKDDRVRQWCAQLLGLYKDVGFGDALVKALGDREPHVRAAAARSLGQLEFKEGLKPLLKLVGDDDPYVRAYVVEALATIDVAAHGGLLKHSLADQEGGVRCFLLGVVPRLLPDAQEELATKGRQDPDWRVRMQAVQNLAKTRTKTSIDTLIEATADARPVVARTAVLALQAFTGMKFTKREQWLGWWQAERENFTFPEGKEAPKHEDPSDTHVEYNGLRVVSDHIAFLIDTSSAMQGRLGDPAGTKAEAARSELEKVLERLEGQLTFNLFTYDVEARPFEKKPVALDAKARKNALAFVDKAGSRGQKDIWNAIRTVVDNEELDTLYLLASGEPEVGLYVHYNRVVEHLVELNRFHKVVVHGVVYSDSNWYREQIKHIADATGGDFKAFK